MVRCMRNLVYLHERLRPLIAVVFAWVHRRITHWLVSLVGRLSLVRRRPGLLRWAAVILSLVAQGVMLYTLAELVELSISLMEVWAELAAKHLEITLDSHQ